MTPAIIPIGPAPAGVGTSGKAAAAGTGLDPDSFRTTLATQTALAAPPAATRNARPTAAAKPTADATELTTTLQTKIAQMLEAGASQADVTAAIAATLAKATADKLGVAGADARKTLQTVFATALAPPGNEPERSRNVRSTSRASPTPSYLSLGSRNESRETSWTLTKRKTSRPKPPPNSMHPRCWRAASRMRGQRASRPHRRRMRRSRRRSHRACPLH